MRHGYKLDSVWDPKHGNTEFIYLNASDLKRLLFKQDGLPRINSVSNMLAQMLDTADYADLQKEVLEDATKRSQGGAR